MSNKAIDFVGLRLHSISQLMWFGLFLGVLVGMYQWVKKHKHCNWPKHFKLGVTGLTAFQGSLVSFLPPQGALRDSGLCCFMPLA
jgi:hypothetical protein